MSSTTTTLNTSSMRLTFDDEFNSFSSSPTGANGATWMTDGAGSYGGPTQGRDLNSAGQAVYYSDASVGYNPYSLSNGTLSITAVPSSVVGGNADGLPYDSGWMNTSTSFSQEYGVFEMNAQLPSGQGMWPAFWLMPENGSWPPEIDVTEQLGSTPGVDYTSIHSNDLPSFNAESVGTTVGSTSTSFHTYGVDWEPDYTTFYYDGQQVYKEATPSDINVPMYMIANLGVGSATGWGGAADGSSTGTMNIDWIRAYASANTVKVSGDAAITGNTPSSATAATTSSAATVAASSTSSTSPSAPTTGYPQSPTSSSTVTGPPTTGSTSSSGSTTSYPQSATSSSTATGTTSSTGSTTSSPQSTNPSSTAASSQVTLTGWGQTASRGDGTYSVTGSGSGGTITLGRGNQTVNLTGSMNHLSLGNGNSSVTMAGDSNVIVAGSGMDTINMGASYGTLSVAGGASGTTSVTATGYGVSVTETGRGNMNVSGLTGAAKVTLGDGSQIVFLGGSGNSVTVGAGNSTIRGGIGQDTVTAGAGNSSISVTGYNNVLQAGAGNSTLNGGSGNDTFILAAAGQGTDTINGFSTTNSDVIDLTKALGGLSIKADLSNLGSYLTAKTAGGNTTLMVNTGGHGGTAQAVAVLDGVSTSVTNLVSHHSLKV